MIKGLKRLLSAFDVDNIANVIVVKKQMYFGGSLINYVKLINGSNGIKITGASGIGLYIDKTANTAGTLKIHCHQMAASTDDSPTQYANEFKGEFLATSGTMDGIAAHFHMAGSGTGVLRSIIGVAYLDSGITLSGTLATGSWISGVLGSVAISGVLDGTAVTATGVYGGLGSMVGATLTACKYMSAIWSDTSQMTQLPSAGETQLLLMTNGAIQLPQAIFIDGGDAIQRFAKFINADNMIVANALVPSAAPDAGTVGADAALVCDIEGTPYYIALYDSLHA